MNEKLCYKGSTFKNEKSNSNVNTYKIYHLPFGMLFYSIESVMVRCKIHQKLASRSKIPVVQNHAHSMTK